MSALRRELAAPPRPVLAPATCGSAKLACIWGMQTAPTPGMCGCRMQHVLSTAHPAWRWVRPPLQPWLKMRKARRADAASGHRLAVNSESYTEYSIRGWAWRAAAGPPGARVARVDAAAGRRGRHGRRVLRLPLCPVRHWRAAHHPDVRAAARAAGATWIPRIRSLCA